MYLVKTRSENILLREIEFEKLNPESQDRLITFRIGNTFLPCNPALGLTNEMFNVGPSVKKENIHRDFTAGQVQILEM